MSDIYDRNNDGLLIYIAAQIVNGEIIPILVNQFPWNIHTKNQNTKRLKVNLNDYPALHLEFNIEKELVLISEYTDDTFKIWIDEYI